MPTLTFEVTEAEADIIRTQARKSRVDFATYARRALLGVGKDESALVGETSRKPGRVVIATPPMTRPAIDAALYEY